MMLIMMKKVMFLLRYFARENKIHILIMKNNEVFFAEFFIIFLCLTGETLIAFDLKT